MAVIASLEDRQAELSRILARQHHAFLRDGPPGVRQRREDLRRLKGEILRRRQDIARALNADFGQRSARETAIVELVPLVRAINYLSRHLPGWMKPERRRVSPYFLFGRAWVVRQPVGVVGIVAPWNYPVSLALVPLATAIAAGNRAMIKPSELTPATSAVIRTIVEAVFPADQAAVVTGDADVGALFAALPFDHLLFTGSTAVGRKVAVAAGHNLTPVTLELGGKSPAVIEPGFLPLRAAEQIVFGKLTNGGQTCIAPDYVLIHEDDRDAFVEACGRVVAKRYPCGFSGSADYTGVVNAHHYDRLAGLVRDAGERGARIVRLGREEPGRGQCGRAAGARVMAPVLLLDVTPQMAVMQEEIFGPVLPVLTYRTIDEAIAFINDRPRPLALYYFGTQSSLQDRVLERTISGDVTINGTLLHYAQDDLPFGGVGASGMGAYHGREGFMALTHPRGIYRQGRWNAATLLRPPFGRLTDILTGFLLR
ncbi:aldehyde dehydrogenase [Gluconacetobacter liquefaciens]|nr:coniferyl aldehyde dehydrogenase [Gluconacetobacter liquefaciens]RDI34151.1 coniferyl-aldehyde dehydrogenase [Gluconacetobacter liquefaciens]GBR05444.1 aldehyde dehydrogenase [Gluconacetobacter liquefaciens NRIC 0522]GEB38980.1 aldehyde dehydrogenase [Gluconacetobacter liquefaciens]